MSERTLTTAILCVSSLALAPASAGWSEAGLLSLPSRKAAADTMHATGTFDVQLTPQATDTTRGSTLGRMSIRKEFHGDLTGSSEGEMLTALTELEGSAGYVAIERFTGTLSGRHGTFVLQHNGTMARGSQHLTIAVVPDSGTDELVGIAGTMSITIADGVHSYDLEYTLP